MIDDVAMLMGSHDVKPTAPIFAAWVLLALAIGGCGVESTAPPTLTTPPLRPLGNADGGCLGQEVSAAYKVSCTTEPHPECCCDNAACTVSCCSDTSHLCVPPGSCFLACKNHPDCLAEDPNGGLLCQSGVCRPPGCQSNNDCAPDSGLVCQEELGTCVPRLKDDGDPPGCSAASAGAGSSALAVVLAALAFAVARRRSR